MPEPPVVTVNEPSGKDLDLKITEVNNRLTASEKRFDDFKGYFAGAATLVTLWFAVLSLVLSWNYSSQKAELRDFQHDLREDLGKSAPLPQLDLLGVNGKALAGQEVRPNFISKDGGLSVVIYFILKNSGSSSTGTMTPKLYTVDPIVLDQKSSDESEFKYEQVINPKDLYLADIPGQIAMQTQLWFSLPGKQIPTAGSYPALLKVYYGQGKLAEARINIVFGRTN